MEASKRPNPKDFIIIERKRGEMNLSSGGGQENRRKTKDISTNFFGTFAFYYFPRNLKFLMWKQPA